MKLIWTYSEYLQKGPINPKLPKEYIFEMYGHSINCAKQFYKTCVYTTEFGATFFKGKVDEIVIIPKDFEYVFLGDLKYYVFENETSPYTLIDGDLFLEAPLILNDNDISVECILPYSKDTGESIFNNFFINEGICDIIPYWKETLPSYNLGLVYIKNNDFIKELCSDFKKVKTFYKEQIEPTYKFDAKNKQPSIVGVQYFFSLFCHYKNIDVDFIIHNNKFTHLAGEKKYNFNSKVSRFKTLF